MAITFAIVLLFWGHHLPVLRLTPEQSLLTCSVDNICSANIALLGMEPESATYKANALPT